MSQFTEALLVSPLADGKTWVIRGPFSYDVGFEGSEDKVVITEGFETDFASIPRLLWIIYPKWGKYGNAAVVHDWLYWDQPRTRKEADDIMLEGMNVLDVSGWQKYPIYWAVRLFGWFAWKRNRWDKEAGYNRVQVRDEVKSTEASSRPGIVKRALQQLAPGEVMEAG